MYENGVKFIACIVVSSDYFIADNNGKISFTSDEDKNFLKELMYGYESDCFIVGRKTYQTVLGKINKPYIVLSKSNYQNYSNKIFTDFANLLKILGSKKLKKPLILGGNEIYLQFIKTKLALKTYMVIEQNICLKNGIKLNSKVSDFGKLQSKIKLSKNTELLTYYRERFVY
ncbi:MAG: dihydrofolate reductase [Rickettsiaceae bacterium H1]|nr:dihydrofolate reductase [Rickettsiaceae bacterium H1]